MPSTEKKDGGPAFPRSTGVVLGAEGMSLRDYAAIKFAATLLTQPQYLEAACGETGEEPGEVVARAAYSYADAMLAERDKP